jgi:surface-anchored protein
MKTIRMRPTLLALVAALAAASFATSARATTIYYVGRHADMGVGWEGGADDDFFMHYHFANSTRFALDDPLSESHSLSQWAAMGVDIDTESLPQDIITYVGEPTVAASSSVASYLGIGAGEGYYQLPAIEEAGKPWLGFGSEELEDFVDSQGNLLFSDLTWTLDSVTGGDVAVWDGAGLLWSTALNDDVFTSPVGHRHPYWGFATAGLYTMTVTVTGTHAQYGLISGTGTYTFQVGPLAPTPPPVTPVPEPSSLALGGLGLLGLGFGAIRRRQRVRRESRA